MKRLSRFVLLALFCGLSIRATAADSSWDIGVLDQILAATQPDQKLAHVGDMEILADRLRAWRNQLAGKPSGNFAFDGIAAPWAGGNVYYSFDVSVSLPKQKAFLDGVAEWAMFANLHFIARSTQASYITIKENPSLGGGQSAVGMVGGEQLLEIGPGAWNRATICHELGHALGLVHEHQRSDRDSYVSILTNNIVPGEEANFVKLGNTLNTGSYDFLSVMHYRRDAFSIDPGVLNTIEPLPQYSQYLYLIGVQYDQILSPSDRAGMAAKYGVGPVLTSVVTNTLDSGPGSLRAAMYYALDHPGTTITFNIPTSDPGFSGQVFTIQPTDNLPGLMRATVLDGGSVPVNSNPNGPEIVINGALCDPESVYSDGLRLTGTNCVVQSLVINGFPGSAIVINGTAATGNVVRGCYLGLNAAGTAPVTNRYEPLVISGGASGNIVGGTNAAARNVISGSAFGGMVIRDSGTHSNFVMGNYVGLNASGTAAVSNANAGLLIYGGAQGNVIGGTTAGAGNVISGNGFEGLGISDTNTTGNIVLGNFFGLNAAGTAAIPNTWAGVSIFRGACSNIIGGTVAGARNVISGNSFQGLTISEAGTRGNVVMGNYIGLDPSGSQAISNGWSGVALFSGAQFNTIGGTASGARNVVSGNSFQGILLTDANTTGNVIAGNYVGVDPIGSDVIPNGWTGVEIGGGSSGNVVGGTIVGAGNVISGNGNYGVAIGGDANVIAGNKIGLDVTSTFALPNIWSGVSISGRSNIIGGSVSSAGNVISGNLNYGLALSGATGNLVQGNRIGLDANENPLGNGWDGVSLYGGATGNVIGLAVDGTGAANEIAFNSSGGIVMFDVATTNNTLRGNSIFSNAYLGINLVGGTEGAWGVTFNDSNDADSGPNQLQNFPVLTQASGGGGNTIVAGTFNGAASRALLIDLYRGDALDASGYGEGQRYVGSISISASAGGAANFSTTVAGNFAGQYITATATDQATGDTSEFSLGLLATNGPTAPNFVQTPILTRTGFLAQISVTIGQSYRVQAATNLGATPIPWGDVTNFVAGATNYVFLDRAATNFPRRFYRVISP